MQWDTATLKQITVTKEMNYDDAFIIEEVVMVTTIHILSTVIGWPQPDWEIQYSSWSDPCY